MAVIGATRPRSHWGRGFTGPALVRLGIVFALVVVSEFVAIRVGDMFLSPPSVVVAKGFASIFSEAKMVWAIRTTFWELGIAFVLSVVFGVLIGLPIGLHRPTYRAAYPLILLVYAVPQVTQNMRPVLLQSARSMGAAQAQLFRHVVLPHMVPSRFAGMRLAMTVTLLGVLLAEFYVSSSGVGYYAKLFTDSLDTTSLFALIVVLAALAVFFNEMVRRAEIRFRRWRD